MPCCQQIQLLEMILYFLNMFSMFVHVKFQLKSAFFLVNVNLALNSFSMINHRIVVNLSTASKYHAIVLQVVRLSESSMQSIVISSTAT